LYLSRSSRPPCVFSPLNACVISQRTCVSRGITPTATHCNALHRTAMHCTALHRTAPHCITLQRTATHCNALHRAAPHVNLMKQAPVVQRGAVCCSVLQCVAVCCSVLQCVAVCCSVLQCVAVCCSHETSPTSPQMSPIFPANDAKHIYVYCLSNLSRPLPCVFALILVSCIQGALCMQVCSFGGI